ncbi:hypothetical protein [Burkholderia gladioli]|uniref:hypothetical protein n=1 Tax=Burkholderia gladioli TaxID=28095 RepID=UPI00164163CE|nr:hypothetical protein [Burkholderia gladioli]
MITVVYGLAAQRCIADEITKNISAIDIIEEVVVNSLPLVFPELVLIYGFERTTDEPSEMELSLSFKVNGIERNSFPVSISFQERLRTRLVMRFGGYFVTEAGALSSTLSRDGNELHEYRMRITLAELPSPTLETRQ